MCGRRTTSLFYFLSEDGVYILMMKNVINRRVTCVGGKPEVRIGFLCEKHEEKSNLQYLDVAGSIISEWILKKSVGRASTRMISLRTRSGELL